MLLPNTNGLSVFDAAVAYAQAGIPVAPFDPTAGKGKDCGNLLGRSDIRDQLGIIDTGKWYDHATTNVATLARWHQTRPFEAIATSPGRFAAIVLDIDNPASFPTAYREACKATAHVITRRKRRGHYWFALPLTHLAAIGNRSFDWGETRCLGGGIVLPPYPRDNRRVVRSGKLVTLPADLLDDFAVCGVVGPAVDLDSFCAKHRGNQYPHKLKGLIGIHNRHLERTNPHDAMRRTLQTGLGEAALGFVPARDVLDTLRARWVRSAREFDSLAVWCATVVEGSDLDALEAMSRRTKGTDSRTYAHKLK